VGLLTWPHSPPTLFLRPIESTCLDLFWPLASAGEMNSHNSVILGLHAHESIRLPLACCSAIAVLAMRYTASKPSSMSLKSKSRYLTTPIRFSARASSMPEANITASIVVRIRQTAADITREITLVRPVVRRSLPCGRLLGRAIYRLFFENGGGRCCWYRSRIQELSSHRSRRLHQSSSSSLPSSYSLL
jgi:hypothetical protein